MTATLRLGQLGLRTSSGATGSPEQDGLARAENVTIGRKGSLEPRRGLARFGVPSPGKTLDRLGIFRGQLVAHADDGYLYTTDVDQGSSPVEVPGALPPAPDARVRFAEAARCLFVSRAGGISRLDAPGGTPVPAGVPGGLDAEASLQLADGQAIPGDCQVAYRGVFGERDGNGRLLLGAPSGRAVLQSPVLEVPVGAFARVGATGVVTANIVKHGLQVGERFDLTGSDPAITDGTFTVATVPDADHFTFTHSTSVGDDANTAACFIAKTTRNAVFGTTIPEGVSGGRHFLRVYRSLESVAADVTPGDEMGLVAEVPVPVGVDLLTLARAGSVVTAKTAVAHTFSPGTLVRVPTGLPGTSNQDVIVGSNAARRSTDGGVTWADVALPGDAYALVYDGTAYVAVGDQFIATSPTGEVWTVRTPAMGFRQWTRLASGGGQLVALSPGRVDISRSCASSAKTQTTVENVGAWSAPAGVWKGTPLIVNGSCYASGEQPNFYPWAPITRQFKAEAEYRVNGGAWTALGSETKAVTFSDPFTQLISFSVGTTPVVDGAMDVRVRVSVVTGDASWPNPIFVQIGATADDPANFWITSETGVTSATVTGPGLASIVQRSTDHGATWSTVYPLQEAASALVDVAWDGSKFVALGMYRGPLGNRVRSWTSADGATWTAATMQGIVANQQAVASDGAGRLVAVGDTTGGIPTFCFSTNGSSWTAPTSRPVGNFRAAAWDATHSRFIAVGNGVCATSPDGQTWTARSITGDFYGIVAHGAAVLAVGVNAASTSADGGETWTARTVSAGTYRGVSGSAGTSIPGGSVLVDTVPDATHFTFASPSGFGDVPEASAPQYVSPLTVGLVDTVPSRLLGEAAYWNATQEGALASHDLPPDCLDLALYRDFMLYAGPKRAPVVLAQLLKVGATEGLQAGDVVTLPGGVVTAAAAEDWAAGQFKVTTDAPTAELNLYRTVQSFCRVVNRSNLGVTAVQTATEESPTPGAFAVVGRDPSSPASISFSAHGTAWSPSQGQTEEPKREVNLIAYSLAGMPDAVPTLNTLPAGRADAKILRLVPLRDCCLILKEDGVFKWTGATPAEFSVQPLDLSCRVIAPESADVLRNTCFALAASGPVIITDSGVAPAPGADDVLDRFEALLSPGRLADTAAQAFGVSYDADATYTLWAPHVAGYRVPCAWTFHARTGEWTERTDPFTHALVMPTNGRLWAVRGSAILRERKDGAFTDFADDSKLWNLTVVSQAGTRVYLSSVDGLERGDVLTQGAAWATVIAVDQSTNIVTLDRASPFAIGTATVDALAAIRVLLKWRPHYVPENPQAQMHAHEAALVFRDLHFANASVLFASDFSGSEDEVQLDAAALELGSDPAIAQRKTVRVLVPRDQRRCTHLDVTLEHLAAYQPFKLDGMVLTYEPGSERHSK